MSNGLGHGTCGVCHVGLLPGWAGNSNRVCGYKGCGKPAVAEAKRVKHVCGDHLIRAGINIPAALARREREWVLAGGQPVRTP